MGRAGRGLRQGFELLPGAAAGQARGGQRHGQAVGPAGIEPSRLRAKPGADRRPGPEPLPNDAEQNIREKNVCQRGKTAKYKSLYDQAFGEPIDCSPNPKEAPDYRTRYKRLAGALAAWPSSAEEESFSSKRDEALSNDDDGHFPLVGLTDQENRGHDLFYGTKSALNPNGRNARCTACHNGVPEGQPADPAGEAAFVIGNLGLAPDEEAAVVAYLTTLPDRYTPSRPRMNQRVGGTSSDAPPRWPVQGNEAEAVASRSTEAGSATWPPRATSRCRCGLTTPPVPPT